MTPRRFPHTMDGMRLLSIILLNVLFVLFVAIPRDATGQTPAPAPAPPPPPPWDLSLGASFVGTGGNSDTSTLGADAVYRRTLDPFKYEVGGSTVRGSDKGQTTVARYTARVLGERTLTPRMSAKAGLRLERDRFAGLNLRSVLWGGLGYKVVQQPKWTLDSVSALTWNHENQRNLGGADSAGLALEALSKYVISPTAETIQRAGLYPSFADANDVRFEGELGVQVAMNNRLAVKIAYLLRYDNEPVPTFRKTDTTATASIVYKLAGTP